MSSICTVVQDETTHHVVDRGLGSYRYAIAHPGCEAVVRDYKRDGILTVLDALDVLVADGDGVLVDMDEEAYVHLRHGRL